MRVGSLAVVSRLAHIASWYARWQFGRGLPCSAVDRASAEAPSDLFVVNRGSAEAPGDMLIVNRESAEAPSDMLVVNRGSTEAPSDMLVVNL